MATTLDIALSYASRYGWRVFPIHGIVNGSCTCRKGVMCDQTGKHPATAHGFKDASSDPDVIRKLFSKAGTVNVGVETGQNSGIFVIDVDPRNGGFESLEELETSRETGPLPKTLVSQTGGGGYHYFYRMPPGGVKSRNGWMPGIDIKANGGYVVLPPSSHLSGTNYTWLDPVTGKPAHETLSPVSEAPEDVVGWIRQGSDTGSSTGTRALTDEQLDKIIAGDIPEGDRNNTYYHAACVLMRKLGSEMAVRTMLMPGAMKAGLEEQEILRAIDSAAKFIAQAKENDLALITGWTPNDGSPDSEETGEIGSRALTDVGNARRLVDYHGEDLRYVGAWGWLKWNGKIWRKLGPQALEVLELSKDLYLHVLDEASREDNNTRSDALTAWAKQSQSYSHVNATMKFAAADVRIVREVHEFDGSRHELPVANGVVDLRTGTLRPYTRDDHFTSISPIEYDPHAVDDRWRTFVRDVCGGDAEFASYIRRAAGYSLTGETKEECFFIVYGPPRTGKSTFLEVLRTVLGTSAHSVMSLLQDQKATEVPLHEVAQLAGKRLVISSEGGESEKLNEQLVKRMTGGDLITGRELYKSAFTFMPTFKLWLATNHLPRIDDVGIWRRIQPIPFLNEVPDGSVDKDLKAHLCSNDGGAKAVLAWLVMGAMIWYQDGLGSCSVVEQFKTSYKNTEDRLGQFIEDKCHVGEHYSVGMKELWTSFRFWSEERGERSPGMNVFSKRIQDRKGMVVEMDGKNKTVKGLALTPQIAAPSKGLGEVISLM